MEWRFLVKHLIFPPGGPLLLLLFSVFFYYRYPRLSRGVLVTAITTLWLFSTPKLTQWLAAPLETYPPLNIKTLNPEDYDAIVRSEEHSLNSSHVSISYAVFCLKKKTK